MTNPTPTPTETAAAAPTTPDADNKREFDANRLRHLEDYQEATCFLTTGNAPVVFRRIRNLVPYGVRFTIVQTYLDTVGQPDVRAGLTVAWDAYFGKGGFREHIDGGHAGLSVAADPGTAGFGLSTSWKTEREVLDYLNGPHAARPDGLRSQYGEGTRHWEGITHVALSGGLSETGPQGRHEHAVVTYTNGNGVSIRTVVAPDYVDPRERAERDAVVLDLAATHLDRDYPAGTPAVPVLRQAAERLRYEQCTLAGHVAEYALLTGRDEEPLP